MTEPIIPTKVPSNNTLGKNKKSIVIGLLVFFLLASGVSVYGYSTQDWFKSARQVYLETEAKNAQSLFDALDTNFKTIEEDYKPFIEGPVHTTQDITANITTDSSQLDSQTQFVLGILQKSKVTLDYSHDPKTKQSAAKVDLSVNGASPITLQAFQDNDKEGLVIPTFYNKFLVANYNDEATITKNLGIKNIPQKLTPATDLLNAIKTSKAELTPIYEQYAKIYVNAIQKDQVKAKSGVITKGDAHVKGKTYTVAFDEAQAKNLVNMLADQLSSDEQLVNLLYSKYTNLINLYQTSGIKLDNVQTKDDLKKSIQDYAKELKTDADKTKPITMVISIDDNQKIVERTVTETGTKNAFRIASWTADKETNFVIDSQTNDSQSNKSFKFTYTMKPQDDKQQKGTIALTIKETGSSPFDVSMNTDFTKTKDTHKTSQVANFKLTTKDNKGNIQLNGSLINDETIENDGQSRTFNTSVKLNLDSPTSGLKGAVLILNSTGKYDFGNPVNLPKLDSGNSLDLGKASQSDMDQYNMQLQQGLGTYLQREPTLLQMLLPFLASGI